MYDDFQGVSFSIVGREDIGTLEIVRLPGRKRIAVSLVKGSYYTPLAYFMNDQDAQQFVDWIRVATRAIS